MKNANDWIRHFYQVLDSQNWAGVLELVQPGCRSHVGGAELDRDGWMGMGKMFYAAFPDGKHSIDQVIADGDKIACVVTYRGTHTGAFQGVPATGKKVALPAITVFRVAEGRVVEHWGQFDAVGLMQQLGAMPA